MDAEDICKWVKGSFDEDDSWDTSCGHKFLLIEGSPHDNEYRFCPACGNIIDTKPKIKTTGKYRRYNMLFIGG